MVRLSSLTHTTHIWTSSLTNELCCHYFLRLQGREGEVPGPSRAKRASNLTNEILLQYFLQLQGREGEAPGPGPSRAKRASKAR